MGTAASPDVLLAPRVDSVLSWVFLLGCLASCASAIAQQNADSVLALKRLTIEELANIEVTSVSRRSELASDAPAAIYVITEEELRRSGARSLPEALRLAPSLQVAQASSRSWAISARGFNAPFSNKLLVMIDGRTVYSPLFSGVFWDAQDTLLEDVERIEVIRGPGAAVWGANAVNGVINIITKNAGDTRGVLLTAGGGGEERVFGGLRYGARAGERLDGRVYAKYFDREDTVFADGQSARDAWHAVQAGFRLDWQRSDQDLITLQGDVYDGRGNQVIGEDITHSGANLLARFVRTLETGKRLRMQTYYDRTKQLAPGDFGDELDTLDIDAQYEWDLSERQHLMIGAGYRFTHDEVANQPDSVSFLPQTLDRHLVSAFVQDEISFPAQGLRLTLGTKLEHNDYTGLEIQPSVRGAWSRDSHVLWAAISRAVRTPSRFDRHLFFPADPPFLFAGGPEFDSEELVAYELGWRFEASDALLVSIASFFHDYDDIRSTSPGTPFVTENNVKGEIHGVELLARWQPAAAWRVSAGYTLLQEDLRVKPGASDVNLAQGETFDPQQQAQLRSSVTLARDVELDFSLRYVDRIGTTGRGFGVVPDYMTVDARAAWSPRPNVDLAIVGLNLLEDRHREFGLREIERSVYGKLTVRF